MINGQKQYYKENSAGKDKNTAHKNKFFQYKTSSFVNWFSLIAMANFGQLIKPDDVRLFDIRDSCQLCFSI